MRGVIIVDTEADYEKWLAQQKPEYYTAFPGLDSLNKKAPADTTASKKQTASIVSIQ